MGEKLVNIAESQRLHPVEPAVLTSALEPERAGKLMRRLHRTALLSTRKHLGLCATALAKTACLNRAKNSFPNRDKNYRLQRVSTQFSPAGPKAAGQRRRERLGTAKYLPKCHRQVDAEGYVIKVAANSHTHTRAHWRARVQVAVAAAR